MKLPFVIRDRSVQSNFDKLATELGTRTYKQTLTLAAGWTAVGSDEAPSYSRIGRLIVLQGGASKTGGTPATGDVICTLPAAARPTGQLQFPTFTQNGDVPGGVLVQANGDIVWRAGSTTETDSTSLAGIIFVAA